MTLLEFQIKEIFVRAGLSLALAESCTGGAVSSRLTDIPGASEYFKGSVVSYSNDVKVDVLGVPGDLLVSVGAVSVEVAESMASGARKILGTDVGAAVTGVAGPGGGSDEKPVGVACIAVARKEGVFGARIKGEGDRAELKTYFGDEVMKMVIKTLSGTGRCHT